MIWGRSWGGGWEIRVQIAPVDVGQREAAVGGGADEGGPWAGWTVVEHWAGLPRVLQASFLVSGAGGGKSRGVLCRTICEGW